MSNIITFYSYKGGVGRSMALANVAYELSKKGLKVLMIDWDLEAPGLEKYFSTFNIRTAGEGLLPLFMEIVRGNKPDFRKFLWKIDIGQKNDLMLLPSGRVNNSEYTKALQEFDWEEFFDKKEGGLFLESLREQWHKEFDAILIDSRTGLSDSSGICTILLPDVLVVMFTANEQSLYGVRDVVTMVKKARQNLASDRMSLTVLPIPSRFGTRSEFTESQKWLDLFAAEMREFFTDWLPVWIDPKVVLEKIKIPQIEYFSYGEKLAVVEHGVIDPEGMGYKYSKIALLLASNFHDIESFYGPDYILLKAAYEKKRETQQGNKNDFEDYHYDIFVSCADNSLTQQWIREHLIPTLNEYLRDALGYAPAIFFYISEVAQGALLFESTQDQLRKSKILLPIVDRNFLGNIKNIADWISFEQRSEINGQNLIFPIVISDHYLLKNAIFGKIPIYDFTEFGLQGEEKMKSVKFQVKFAHAIENLSRVLSVAIKGVPRYSEWPLIKPHIIIRSPGEGSGTTIETENIRRQRVGKI